MNNFRQNINSFIDSFNNGKGIESISLLKDSFQANSKLTIERLHFNKLLFNSHFIELTIGNVDLPEEYSLLLKMLSLNTVAIKSKEGFILNLSKEQILEGIAIILEKNNAEYKYNQAWNRKNTNSSDEYLETERQNIYSTYSGIYFQELLKLYYNEASESNIQNLIWNEENINKLNEFILTLSQKINLNDEIEKHLFFNWTLEIINDTTLKSVAPINQRESKLEYDYINSLKNKILHDSVDITANQNLVKTYFETLRKGPSSEVYKYFPDQNDAFEMQAFANAFLIDLKADLTVEKELAFVNEKYFPMHSDLDSIELNDGSNLPLKKVFRISAFLCEMSKAVISDIDEQYNLGIARFSYETTDNYKSLERQLKFNNGNPKRQKEILDAYYSEEIYKEQQQIISKAKENIDNQFCLIKFPLDLLVKSMQWTNQFDEEFILKVIDFFTYKPNCNFNVSYNPIFRIGDYLYWIPNMIAYHPFAEKLFDNLLSKKLLNFDRPQTNFYENNLKQVFKKFGYKIIENDSNKVIKNSDKMPIGDFDLLAYKEGKLIHMQLKLTHIRNSFFERYKFIEKLNKASNQIETGNKYIRENEACIRKILNLKDDEKIEKIQSLIISNSFLFDHDIFNGFLKVNYKEVLKALDVINHLQKSQNTEQRIDLFTLLSENLLFKHLDDFPIKYNDAPINIGHYKLLVPTIIQQNIYTSIN